MLSKIFNIDSLVVWSISFSEKSSSCSMILRILIISLLMSNMLSLNELFKLSIIISWEYSEEEFIIFEI